MFSWAFQILERIGFVAYRIGLPVSTRIHNVFHVSLLKDPSSQQAPLPYDFMGSHPLLQPAAILGYRKILQQGQQLPQVLVQWQGQPDSDATWELLSDFQKDFPHFNLEDKVIFEARGNDASQNAYLDQNADLDKELRRSNRMTKKPTKWNDFI